MVFFFCPFDLWHQVIVHEAEQKLEHLCLHVAHMYGTGGCPLLHGAEKLGLEDSGPGSKHAPVRSERLAADLERHVCTHPGLEETGEILPNICRRR